MKKYVCEPCGYVYDPEVGDPDNGIAPGTAFEDLPEVGYARSAELEKMNLQKRRNHASSFFSLR